MAVTTSSSFVKRYEPDLFAAEATKARLLADAGAAVGVRVPRVLAVDERTCTVHYERVECPYSLLDLMSSRQVTMADLVIRVERSGAALADLHVAMPADEAYPHRLRSPWFEQALGDETPSESVRLVLQHGDYGYSNIRFDRAGELVVIDPSPNRYVTVHPLNVDDPELDLALVGSNFLGRTVRPLAMARTIAHGPELFEALVRGYEGRGGPIDRPRLRRHTVATVEAFAHWCQRGRPQLLVPLARLLERNLP